VSAKQRFQQLAQAYHLGDLSTLGRTILEDGLVQTSTGTWVNAAP
jgi:hypothetical protein